MAASFPPIEAPRARALRESMERLAAVLAPGWAGPSEPDSFGSALYEIAARLAEETTQRLSQTAARDAIAFFDELDLAPSAPRAASAVLAFQLVEARETPVSVPDRVQVAAAAEDGTEVIFESHGAVKLAPGRLAEIFSVDPVTDRIERAPDAVVALEQPDLVPIYKALSFAGIGSHTVQLTPGFGLEEGDLLKVGRRTYRIEAVDGGLITLVEQLDEAIAADATVTRLDALRTFDLRNLQGHEFYVGHAELLNLKQPARLFVEFSPASLARRLSQLNVTYSLWGTADGDEGPAWHELGQLGAKGDELSFVKTWTGSVDELEIDGSKSRWIRAVLRDPIEDRSSLGMIANEVGVRVESEPIADATSTEGSTTITQAFHNGAPLSVASRFYPFGPEPLRFDTFALAAPETLSKKGAEAKLHVSLVDSTLSSLHIVVSANGGPRAYGVAANGHLQALALGDGELLWQDLRPPAEPEGGGALNLDGDWGLLTLGLNAAGKVKDLVIARDTNGGLWSGVVDAANAGPKPPMSEPVWAPLPALPAVADTTVQISMVANTSGVAAGVHAVVFASRDDGLYSLRLTSEGKVLPETSLDSEPVVEWRLVVPTGASVPLIDAASPVVAVHGPTWPVPTGAALEIVTLDVSGAMWLGTVTAASPPSDLEVEWEELDPGGQRLGNPAVRPFATRFVSREGTDGLWVTVAEVGTSTLTALLRLDGDPDEFVDSPPASAFSVSDGSWIHANPLVLGFPGEWPVTVAIGHAGGDAVGIWGWDGDLDLQIVPSPAPKLTPQIFLSGNDASDASLVVGGTGERLLTGSLARRRELVAVLRNGLDSPAAESAHVLEITNGSDPGLRGFSSDARIVVRNVGGDVVGRIYAVDEGQALAVGDDYRFMRHADTAVFDLSGSVAGDPSILTLHDDDETTDATHRVVIGNASYDVAAFAPGIATLDRMVPDGPAVLYTPVETQHEHTVAPEDLGTLVLLSEDGDSPGAVFVLDFGGTNPRFQDVLQSNPGGSWVRLGDAWAPVPTSPAPAAILTELAAVSWVSRELPRGYQNPDLSWEYFNGDGWRRLDDGFYDGTDNLATSGFITFQVPSNLETTEIAGQEDYWIRARLIGGDYGRPDYVVLTEPLDEPEGASTQTINIDTSRLRPPEVAAIEATFKLDDVVAPDVVLVDNNQAVSDQTQASAAAEARFDLFQGARALDPDNGARSIFLGFTMPPRVSGLRIYADVEDQPGLARLRADVFTAIGWSRVSVDDETQCLRRRGFFTISLSADPILAPFFGVERYWIRLRPESDSVADDWAPVISGLYPNASPARQAKTITQEILGSSLGEPAMTVRLSEHPMLPETLELRVRENLSAEERDALVAEALSRTRVTGTEEPKPLATAVGAPGDWVLWHRTDSFVGSDGDSRVYLLDPATGEVTFGDGRAGKIPPAGRDAVRAFSYQQGGGRVGNLAAWTELKTKSAVEAVELVALPVDSAGGVDPPRPASLIATAPERLRHAGQALTPVDYEALAVASSPDIVRARCFPPSTPSEPIRLAIAVRQERVRCPVPSLAHREAIARFMRDKGWGGLADESIAVTGPEFLQIGVRVQLTAPTDQIAAVEDQAFNALKLLLDPIDGGPHGTGWEFGRRLWPSDVLRTLSSIEALDQVNDVELYTIDPSQSLDAVAPDALICGDPEAITVVVEPGGVS